MGTRTRCRTCDAILSADNRGAQCRPCVAAAVVSGKAPVQRAEFWQRSEIADAIAARHVGRLFLAYRRAHTPTLPQTTLLSGSSSLRARSASLNAPDGPSATWNVWGGDAMRWVSRSTCGGFADPLPHSHKRLTRPVTGWSPR